MAARIVPTAAVRTAAVVVYALHVSCRNRRLRRLLARERATHHLVAGSMARDLEEFQRRMGEALVQDAVAAAAGCALDEALTNHHTTIPPTEGGTR